MYGSGAAIRSQQPELVQRLRADGRADAVAVARDYLVALQEVEGLIESVAREVGNLLAQLGSGPPPVVVVTEKLHDYGALRAVQDLV